MTNEPFGRQPKPVTVTIIGDELEDIRYWTQELMNRAGFKGDLVDQLGSGIFRIFPRAVNN